MSFIIHFDPPPIPLRSSSPPNPLTFMYLSSLSLKKKNSRNQTQYQSKKTRKPPTKMKIQQACKYAKDQ